MPSVGIPITLSWHFDIGDPDDVFFQRRDIGEQYFFQGDDIRAEITHPNGTLQVAFPSIGYVPTRSLEESAFILCAIEDLSLMP